MPSALDQLVSLRDAPERHDIPLDPWLRDGMIDDVGHRFFQAQAQRVERCP